MLMLRSAAAGLVVLALGTAAQMINPACEDQCTLHLTSCCQDPVANAADCVFFTSCGIFDSPADDGPFCANRVLACNQLCTGDSPELEFGGPQNLECGPGAPLSPSRRSRK